MRKINPLIYVCASFTCFLLFFILYAIAIIYNPEPLFKSFFIPIWFGVKMIVLSDHGGVVLLFNHGVPYAGSIITGKMHVWSGLGVRCTVIDCGGGLGRWWTLVFSVWYPLFLFFVFPFGYTVKILFVKFKVNSTRQPKNP